LSSVFINDINNYSPIGCRDEYTRETLLKHGITSFFSSCLTTTLDLNFFIHKDKRTDEIIFIDYKFGNYPKADEYLLSLKSYNFNNITYTKHYFNINMTHIERFQLAKQLLDKYARAKLVISTRIHGALPCLAFNTPVIFINQKYDYERYTGLYTNLLKIYA
jgi:exopolysaccharide biosynthesis predicted pyruvyltransferase EpsI